MKFGFARSAQRHGGITVRISENVRKLVVFLGHEDSTPGKGGIDCIGIGFLVGCEPEGYLVTAKHLADALGDDPFLVRVNLKDGSSQNIPVNTVQWFRHPDPTVDVAAIKVSFRRENNFDTLYFAAHMMLTDRRLKTETIGIGDWAYAVGLFRLMSGQKRNLSIAHSGIIAMMPGGLGRRSRTFGASSFGSAALIVPSPEGPLAGIMMTLFVDLR
jgi:hypothetical protein